MVLLLNIFSLYVKYTQRTENDSFEFQSQAEKGTSTVEAHDSWIAVDTINVEVARAISTSGDGADRNTSNPLFSEFRLKKSTDLASADIFMEAVCGKSLGTAEIHFVQTGGADIKDQVFLKLELEEAIISDYQLSSTGERPH